MKKNHIFPERFTKNGKRAILSGYPAEPFRIRYFARVRGFVLWSAGGRPPC